MRKMLATVAFVVSFGVWLWPGTCLHASSRREYREAIRSLPLLERPNRPGHIYGNTVRRIYHRRYGSLPAAREGGQGAQSIPSDPAPSPTVH